MMDIREREICLLTFREKSQVFAVFAIRMSESAKDMERRERREKSFSEHCDADSASSEVMLEFWKDVVVDRDREGHTVVVKRGGDAKLVCHANCVNVEAHRPALHASDTSAAATATTTTTITTTNDNKRHIDETFVV